MRGATVRLAVAFAAAFFALAPSALANLDPSYGEGGRAVLPLPADEVGAGAALMRDDRLVLAGNSSLRRLTASGQPDSSFGAGGTLTPTAPQGGTFTIAGVAVDSLNRLIVAGTAETKEGDGRLLVAARVLRYLPSGAPDPSFGEGGVVETRFGLPPAPGEAQPPTQTLPLSPAAVDSPTVAISGVAVDASDRVVLTGGASVGYEFGCFHDWFWDTRTHAAFVARLSADGAPDPAFGGGDGLFGGQSTAENQLAAEFSTDPTIGPGGEVTFSSGRGTCPANEGAIGLGRLGADGTSQLAFGGNAGVRRFGDEAAVAADGSTFSLGWVTPWYFTKEALTVRLARLGTDGKPVRSFGNRGQTTIASPGGETSTLSDPVLDSRGGILLGGTMIAAKVPRRGAKAKPRRAWLVLVRVRPNGRRDRGFGPGGKMATSFAPLRASESGLLLDSQGRALVVGTYGRNDRTHGLVVARFLTGH